MSEIFSEQLTAVATLALAILALATAWYARRAYKAQAAELKDQLELSKEQTPVLKLQARELQKSIDEREREAEERRRAQAAQVTAWFGLKSGTVSDWGAILRNASGLPVFDVRISFNWIYDQPGGREWVGIPYGSLPGPVTIVPPDTTRHFRIPAEVQRQDPRCDDEVYAVGITFTDAAGNRWERDPRGAPKPLS